MKIKKGHYRIVLVLPFLGIAIKFPIVHVLGTMKTVFFLAKEMKWKTIRMLFTFKSDLGFRKRLFGGILDNWREFTFFLKTRHPFLQPTYFSFFGLFNVQKVSEQCDIKYVDLWCQLYELTNGRVWDDSHHFENPDNFCFRDGKLRMLDYGSSRTHRVVIEYGQKILDSFNPSFDWEAIKRARQAQKTE